MFSTSTIVQLKRTVWACQRHLSVTVCLGHWGQKGPQLFFKADFFIYVWTMFSLRVWSTGGLAFQFLWEVCARRHGLMINHRGKVWKTLWTTSKVQCLVKWELQCLVKWETVFDYSLSGHFVLFHNVLCPVTGSLWKRQLQDDAGFVSSAVCQGWRECAGRSKDILYGQNLLPM